MCGINGIINTAKTETKILSNFLSEMNNKIIHRGPDQDGFYNKMFDDYSIGMAMRRLSIIDLRTGNQPIFSSDNKRVLIFNGEIYNYISLRKHLITLGITFKTKSDTEVILKLYEKYGVASFAMLDGMFVFLVYMIILWIKYL